jgi:glycosyltransferase involved in cell wall biosynthesis
MNPKPRVSIIIATKNRQDMLVTSIIAILQQAYCDFEVIVVDTTGKPCEGLPSDPRLTYISPTDAPGNRNWQRNVGLSRATGEIAVVCDDDIIPSPQWLDEMVAPYVDENVAGVGGRVIEGPDVAVRKTSGREVGYVSWWGQVEGEFRARTPGLVEVDHLKGCNLSFRSSVLRDIGGYDERIDGWAMRDETDVCVRIRQRGYKLLYSPTAVVEHFGLNLWSNQDIRLGPPKNAYSGAKTTTYFVFRNLGAKAGTTWVAYLLAFTGWQTLKSMYRMLARVVMAPIGCVAGIIEASKPPLNAGLNHPHPDPLPAYQERGPERAAWSAAPGMSGKDRGEGEINRRTASVA